MHKQVRNVLPVKGQGHIPIGSPFRTSLWPETGHKENEFAGFFVFFFFFFFFFFFNFQNQILAETFYTKINVLQEK